MSTNTHFIMIAGIDTACKHYTCSLFDQLSFTTVRENGRDNKESTIRSHGQHLEQDT